MELMQAYQQWKDRPEDERFETLSTLKASVEARRNRARQISVKPIDIEPIARDNDRIVLSLSGEPAIPTHWAFGQMAALAQAPAGYIRNLPAPLAVDCLNYGLRQRTQDKMMLLLDTKEDGSLTSMRSATSENYGRIWDIEAVGIVEQIVAYTEGRFFNPKEWSGRPSGLYASDRDVFMFMIDGGSMVDGGGERDQMNRGFFVWNSEVGAATFGLSTFLFREVCGNHIVWGAADVKTLKIRHNGLAPQRFAREAMPVLRTYVESSTKSTEDAVRRAKTYLLPNDREQRIEWVTQKGFTKAEASGGIRVAEKEEGDSRTLWQVVNGLTAYAREYAFMDTRVALERKASKLMDLV